MMNLIYILFGLSFVSRFESFSLFPGRHRANTVSFGSILSDPNAVDCKIELLKQQLLTLILRQRDLEDKRLFFLKNDFLTKNENRNQQVLYLAEKLEAEFNKHQMVNEINSNVYGKWDLMFTNSPNFKFNPLYISLKKINKKANLHGMFGLWHSIHGKMTQSFMKVTKQCQTISKNEIRTELTCSLFPPFF
jgi:hypothetical protein